MSERSAEQQEEAMRQHVQTMIARDRAARAADTQTAQTAQANVAKDDAKTREDATEGRRVRQGYTLR
jgi:hypothetical protein